MKIFSRFLVASTLSATLGFAGAINGISVIINDQPITLYEVYKYSESFKISKQKALDILVRQKLEDAEIKKLRIDANIFEVDQYIEDLATKNGMSTYEFMQMLKQQNIDSDEYKKDLKTKIKRDKLYQKIYSEKLKPIDNAQLKEYYTNNPEQFEVANSFDIVTYTGENPTNLEDIAQNPMLRPSGIEVNETTLKADEIDNRLKGILNGTKEGTFSQVLNIENKATMFFIKKKDGISMIPFEQVKNMIYSVLSKQNEEKTINDYFEKIKSSATFKVLRNPS